VERKEPSDENEHGCKGFFNQKNDFLKAKRITAVETDQIK
jgi:hypothetical protein